ncbi:hypothetical protein NIES22_68830 (plasmid) [Calothrix brevissima NIES-22]|nr:hypothetical protein NIES22_68830 [Calothrix brevissima NIES-22]
MKKISIFFSEERNQLQKDIESTTSIEQIVKLIQNRLDNLEIIYISELNLTQVRLASLFLDTLRQSIGTLTAANLAQIPSTQQKQITNSATNLNPNRVILKLLKILLYIGILAWLFYLTQTTSSAWMAILLVAVLLGLEVVLQLDKNNQDDNPTSQALLNLPQAVLQVNSQVLLDNLADALHTIDLAIARFDAGSKPEDDLGIEELPELLGFLQKLMGASFLDKPQMAIALAQLLPQILMEQGIRAQIYRVNEIILILSQVSTLTAKIM